MNAIRNLIEDKSVYNEDTYCAVLPVFDCGEFLVVCHYKRRGRTEGAFIVDEGSVLPLTYDEAVVILRQYANGTMENGHYRPTQVKTPDTPTRDAEILQYLNNAVSAIDGRGPQTARQYIKSAAKLLLT